MQSPELRIEEVVLKVELEEGGVGLEVQAPTAINLTVGGQGPPGPPGAGILRVDGGRFDNEEEG